ncbi:MAG: DUF222 domain-containing protein, partial [Thermoplasmata archaeon]
RLPDAEGAVVEKALSRLAEQAPPDPATGVFEELECRLADALVEVSSANLAADPDADRATVVVHVDAGVLSQETDEGLAELEPGRAICGDTARRLACDARWQLVAEGPDGEALGVGRMTRQVPPWLSRQLRRRDRGCRFPGCPRSRWLHAHHLRHWSEGGPTDPDNLVMLCGHHHRLVHEGGWRMTGDPSQLSFVHPAGHELVTHPPPLRPEVMQRL